MSGQRDLRWVWLASEVLLVLTSIAGVRLLQRLYEDTTFLAPMLFSVIVAHGVLVVMRWFGFGAIVASAVSFVGVVLSIVATHYSATATAVIIPSGASIDQFRGDLDVARDVFNTLQTPVPAVTGFIVAGSLIFWALIVTADWAAFRLFAPGQALVPMLTVLVFVSLLGVETDRVSTTAALVIAGVLFLLAHRSAARAAQGIWLDSGPGRGYAALMSAGAIVAVLAVLAGVMGGPSVPGAEEAPLIEIGDEGRRETKPIEVISPLVQIQPRLIDQSDEVLFTVETNERAYWRIAALDKFDGALWRSQGQFRGTGDGLEVAYPSPGVPTTNVTAVFDLGSLNVVWAPAAYLPTSVETLGGDADLNYEAESATFIVDTNAQRVSDGLVYRVQSSIPDFTPNLLRRLPSITNETADPRYLELPADYSPLARSEAQRITEGLTTDYDRALALQNYFRENFTYDIDVAKGHDIRRLEDFLTVQRGYCEQFAGTFASMARAIGIPARVATGFTPGEQDPTNPNRYLISGKHAHAWPEVWIAGAGWVAFEPTPGRGAPNATEYTGVPESQAESNPEPAQEQAAEAAQEAEETAPQPTPTPAPPEAVQPIEPVPVEPEELVVEAVEEPASIPWVWLGVLAAIAGWFVGIPFLKRLRTRRRMERLGQDTRRQITLTWSSVVDRFEAIGHPPKGAETLAEYAARLQFDLPLSWPAFGELTELTIDAAYAPEAPSLAVAEQAVAHADSVYKAIDANQPMLVRGAHEIDPRPLLRFGDPVVTRANNLAAGATTIPGATAVLDGDALGSGDQDLIDPVLAND
jgi:transglutaminase-like putative cysteine protease